MTATNLCGGPGNDDMKGGPGGTVADRGDHMLGGGGADPFKEKTATTPSGAEPEATCSTAIREATV